MGTVPMTICASGAEAGPAEVDPLLGSGWDFEDGKTEKWRHKDNATVAVAVDGGNRCLRLASGFSPYQFTWTTVTFPKAHARGVAHIDFRVRGDGSGNRLHVTLGCPAPEGRGSLYYANTKQEIALDFTGWRTACVDIEYFATPAGGLRDRDMEGLTFLQFMIRAGEPPKAVDICVDDIKFSGPTAKEIAAAETEKTERGEILRTVGPILDENSTAIQRVRAGLEAAAGEGKFVDVARLYLAALEWCNEDARRCATAEELPIARQALAFSRDVSSRLADQGRLMGRVLGRRPDEGDPLQAAKNPYFLSLIKVATSLSRKEQSWPKGRKGFRSIDNAWRFASLGNNCFDAAWAITRSGSPLRHNATLLRNALNMLDTIGHQHTDGDFNIDRSAIYGRDPNINRFCLAPALDAWRELSLAYPDLLPETKKADLERGLRRLVDYQVDDYGTPRLARQPHEKHPVYPNMDVHHILIMELAHRLWGDARYAKERDVFVEMLGASVYPMGAWPYINTQNECFVYHHLNVVLSARYWAISKNPRTLEMLRRTIPFYPRNVEPAGMPEYYTDCCWKHYWSGGAATGPDVIAGLFDCALNKVVAARAGDVWGYGHGYQTGIAAEFWKPVPPKPLPDNYVIYDADIEGPRGRYGTWSFAANGRNFGVGYQGKDTFVGCMITDPARRPLPLDAALQIVTAEVRLKRDGNHWTAGRYCSALEKLDKALGPDCGSLAVRYTVSKPNWHHKEDELLPWEGTQTWYLSKDRLVGLVSLGATTDDRRAAIIGRIRLGMSREIEPDGKDAWRYGNMAIRIHAHNYSKIEIRPSETFYLDKPENYKSTEITLVDPLSVQNARGDDVVFKKGTAFDFLVEVRPVSSPGVEALVRIDAGGCSGFQFMENGRSACVMHNPTDGALSIPLPTSLIDATAYDDTTGKGRKVVGPQLALQPHRHVLLIK